MVQSLRVGLLLTTYLVLLLAFGVALSGCGGEPGSSSLSPGGTPKT